MKKTGFFEEGEGNRSMTRLVFFMLICFAIIASSAMLGCGLVKYLRKDSVETLMGIATAIFSLIGTITGITGTLKIIQKSTEVSNNDCK